MDSYNPPFPTVLLFLLVYVGAQASKLARGSDHAEPPAMGARN